MGNAYYDQLAKMIIAKPSIQLMQGEVCFYDWFHKLEIGEKNYGLYDKRIQDLQRERDFPHL